MRMNVEDKKETIESLKMLLSENTGVRVSAMQKGYIKACLDVLEGKLEL